MNSTAISLPDTNRAKLPELYRAAKKALSECSRIDECAEWANKAEALSSYARQAKDEDLRRTADRIQARALRRCGELLKQIPDDQRGRPPENSGESRPNLQGWIPGTHPTRSQAAEDAGLSEHRKKTALRLASVPEESFENQVSSDVPPTLTALAEQGTAHIVKTHDAVRAAVLKRLKEFVEFCESSDPVSCAESFANGEAKKARALVSKIDSWLDQFVTRI